MREENKELEKKEEEYFTNDEEKNLYIELIDLKDYIPEILLIPPKRIDKNLVKNENQEENIMEQQPQIKILNNQENSQNKAECILN